MDLLTREGLEAIANPGAGGTHISLFMPTHRAGGSEIEADRIRWKNLVTGVEAVLLERMKRPEAEVLLEPAKRLLEDTMEWQDMSDGLAMYLSSSGHRTYRVPAPMTTLATVGERTVLGPLVRLLSGDEHFFVLALSQQKIRLLEGSRNTVEEVTLADVPTSLSDVSKPEDPRTDAVARPVAGRGGPAVFYGHGGTEENLKEEGVVRFLRQVSGGLDDVLRGQTSPMVLVGLEQLQGAYRQLNSYPHLMSDAVDHNADDLSNEELHRHAWPLVEKRLQGRREEVFEKFKEFHGTGQVSSDLATVSTAATEGRVETLFVRADPWAWERATDDLEPVVELGTDERYAEAELVDEVAVATLNNGGRIFATAQNAVADSEVAAIFRY